MSEQHEEHRPPDQEEQPELCSNLDMAVSLIVFFAVCFLLLRYVAVPIILWLETNTNIIGLLFLLGWGMVILWGILAAIRLIAAVIEATLHDED